MFEDEAADEDEGVNEPLNDIKLFLYSTLALLVFWCVLNCGCFNFSSFLTGPTAFDGDIIDSDVDLEFFSNSSLLLFFMESLEDLEDFNFSDDLTLLWL